MTNTMNRNQSQGRARLLKARLPVLAASLLMILAGGSLTPASAQDLVVVGLAPPIPAPSLPAAVFADGATDDGYCRPSSNADENCADDIAVGQYNVPTIYYCPASCATPTNGRVTVYLTISPPGYSRTFEYGGYCDFTAGAVTLCKGTQGGRAPYWADALHGKSTNADSWAVGVKKYNSNADVQMIDGIQLVALDPLLATQGEELP